MTPQNSLRYARQIRLPEVGIEGQERLSQASALVIGAGGLGAPALHYLVASGMGRVGFVEFDSVDVTNLHRQTLYSSDDVGKPKVEAAADRLHRINPAVTLEPHPVKLAAANAAGLIGDYDVVLDGSDTFATRYLVNDASVRTRTPNIFASVSRFSGQASVFGTETGPCYRCLFPDPPPPDLVPNCEDGGVLGVVPSLMGTIQAAEALKHVLGLGESLAGRLLMIDVLAFEVREIAVARDPGCPVCGDDPRAVSRQPTEVAEITVAELRARLEAHPPELLDVREAAERAAGHLGGRHIPVGQVAARSFELDALRDREIVVYCKSGGRSAQAARVLQDKGFRVRSLRGGFDAWSAQP